MHKYHKVTERRLTTIIQTEKYPIVLPFGLLYGDCNQTLKSANIYMSIKLSCSATNHYYAPCSFGP